jgi:hypothetical protein
MSDSLIERRKLEKFLLDGDVKIELQALLGAVGFTTEVAKNVPVNIRNDSALVRYARENGYILVCHDKHRDRKTNQHLYPEIYHRGGQVLRISGNGSQDPLLSLGKVLIHRELWRRFFAEHDGIAILYRDRMVGQEAALLYLYIQRPMDLLKDPVAALRKRKPVRRTRRKTQKTPRASAPLL